MTESVPSVRIIVSWWGVYTNAAIAVVPRVRSCTVLYLCRKCFSKMTAYGIDLANFFFGGLQVLGLLFIVPGCATVYTFPAGKLRLL